MKTIEIRNTIIGSGKPKVCAPVACESEAEILKACRRAEKSPDVDLVEWRLDWYENALDEEAVTILLSKIRGMLQCPLLVTFRSKKEGGEKEISNGQYAALYSRVLESGSADLVDLELSMGEETIRMLAQEARTHRVYTVFSSHDFAKTPSEDEMLHRMRRMQELGADICKLAVMPNSATDVARLLLATAKMKENYASVPIVTMSMSKLGVISRVSGEIFGSAITFGTIGLASAPGQMEVETVNLILEMFHRT